MDVDDEPSDTEDPTPKLPTNEPLQERIIDALLHLPDGQPISYQSR